MIAIKHEHTAILREYNGVSEPFMASATAFLTLLTYVEEPNALVAVKAAPESVLPV
jgi:hypothetical protein